MNNNELDNERENMELYSNDSFNNTYMDGLGEEQSYEEMLPDETFDNSHINSYTKSIQQKEQLQNSIRNVNKNQNAAQRLRQRNVNTLGKKVESNHSTSSNNNGNNQENNQQDNQGINNKLTDKINPANKLKNFENNAKNAAKQKAKEAGKAVAKGIATGIKALATNPATAPAFWTIMGALILVIMVPVFISIFNSDSGGGNGSSSNSSSNGLICNYNVNGNEYSDIKVQLMECDKSNLTPIAGEELVDFDKYVLGVAYAENFSNENATKAQMIAARSYTLTRRGIIEENGQKIIQMRNCTMDQVYCNPDKGCWSNSASAGATVHSGVDNSKAYHRGPMDVNHEARKWAEDVSGIVLKDSSGNVINTPYCSDYGVCKFCTIGSCMSQDEATSLGTSGKDFREILMYQYSGINNGYTLGEECESAINEPVEIIANSEIENWKQCDSAWGSIWLGGKYGGSVCSIGCAATSISIQIARSGVSTTVSPFNPGAFANTVQANGGFSSGGGITWSMTTTVAPKFVYDNQYYIYGSKTEKVNKINSLIADGNKFAIVGKPDCCDKNGGWYAGHWVAYNKGVGDIIYDFDPAGYSKLGRLFEDYPNSARSDLFVRVVIYRKEN